MTTSIEHAAGPQRVVRLWDSDWKLAAQLDDAGIAEPRAGGRTLTLPITDPAARWLASRAENEDSGGRGACMTIDGPDGRWSGALTFWQVGRGGECKECQHCRQWQMTAYWAGAQAAEVGACG